jgi:hypothetical protein
MLTAMRAFVARQNAAICCARVSLADRRSFLAGGPWCHLGPRVALRNSQARSTLRVIADYGKAWPTGIGEPGQAQGE